MNHQSTPTIAKPPLARSTLQGSNVALTGRGVVIELFDDSLRDFRIKSGEVALAGCRPNNFSHKPRSRNNSAVVYVGSPARNEASASSIARRSSSVVGSSSTGALRSESATGSNCSAGGIPEVCTRPAGLHSERPLCEGWPPGPPWATVMGSEQHRQ